MAAPSAKDLEMFCGFLNENRIVVADTSSASRVRLAATLVELGVRTTNLTLCSGFEEAEQALRTLQPTPKLVLCDYMLGSKSGLDLLQAQRENGVSEDAVFILVTGNTSQSAVARAAEEDVDSFILKPYTLETLRAGLVNAVIAKVYPSDYMKMIREGKEQLFSRKLDEAEKTFDAAEKLDQSPTLALFYKGQAQKMKKALDVAENTFKDGLGVNKIHYKCLVGLHDLLMEEKRYQEAYDIVKKIAQYFPANPKRLASVLRLAIMTEHYEDMEGYYRLFTQLDTRTDELVAYICSAMVVCGKFYLQRKHRQRAVEVFEKVATSCAGQIRFIKYIVEALVDRNYTEAAGPFFKKYQSMDNASTAFKTLEFLVSDRKEQIAATVGKGQALIRAGVKDALVYRIMIECCGKGGLNDAARNMADIAIREYPDQKEEFEAALATFVKERPVTRAPALAPAPKPAKQEQAA